MPRPLVRMRNVYPSVIVWIMSFVLVKKKHHCHICVNNFHIFWSCARVHYFYLENTTLKKKKKKSKEQMKHHRRYIRWRMTTTYQALSLYTPVTKRHNFQLRNKYIIVTIFTPPPYKHTNSHNNNSWTFLCALTSIQLPVFVCLCVSYLSCVCVCVLHLLETSHTSIQKRIQISARCPAAIDRLAVATNLTQTRVSLCCP